MKMSKTENIHCSFCGRSREEVKMLIAGQEGLFASTVLNMLMRL